MIVEIEVGGWEHECCGQEIRLNDLVEWAYYTDEHGLRHETHHIPEDATGTVSGRVAGLDVIDHAGGRTAIERVPSGAEVLTSSPEGTPRFLVTLDVA